jgi:hypothetical protein
MVWSVPAFAVTAERVVVILTSSILEGHGKLVIVHLNTLVPFPSPVTVVFGSEGFAIVPVPEMRLHWPTPVAGTFASSVATEVQRF